MKKTLRNFKNDPITDIIICPYCKEQNNTFTAHQTKSSYLVLKCLNCGGVTETLLNRKEKKKTLK